MHAERGQVQRIRLEIAYRRLMQTMVIGLRGVLSP